MTRILFDPRVDLPTGTTTSSPVTVEATPTGIRTDGSIYILPTTLTFTINTAADQILLAPPAASWAWRVTVRQNNVIRQQRTIRFPDQPSITWQACSDVDPATLTVTTGTATQWDATFSQIVTMLSSVTSGLTDDLNQWQPNTVYTTGTLVLNPSAQIVSANSNFTSGATYNAANWTIQTLNVNGVTALIGQLAANRITQQSTQTVSFTAAASNLYPVDATAGNITVTLPVSQAGQTIQVKKLDANAATGATAGIVNVTGTINGATGAIVPIRKQGMGKEYLADGTGGWTAALGDLDITKLGATTGEPGTVQLAGDLAGTSAAPTVPGLAKRVQTWQPTTAYTAGAVVLSPAGYLVQAVADFTSGLAFNAANWLQLSIDPASVAATYQPLLPTTGVKTAAYTSVGNEIVPVDTSVGAFAVTLPTAPADKTRVSVKLIASAASLNPLTITPGTGDVFNKVAGATSLTLLLLNQAITLQYVALTHVWVVLSDDLPLGQLSAAFGPRPSSVVVAASDSVVKLGGKAADYVCTGTDDQTTINAALAALPANGGSVTLLAGTYSLSGSVVIAKKSVAVKGETLGFWDEYVGNMPSNSAAEGVGATKLKATAATFPLIKVDNTGMPGATGRTNGVEISRLYLYGKSKTTTTSIAIVCDDIGRPSDMLKIEDVFAHNTYDGFRLRIDAGIVSRCSIQDIGNDAIVFLNGGTNAQGGTWNCAYPQVEKCVIADIGGRAIDVQSNTIAPIIRGNVIARTAGVRIDGTEWVVEGNFIGYGHQNVTTDFAVLVTAANSGYQRGGTMTGNTIVGPVKLDYTYGATVTGNRIRILAGTTLPALEVAGCAESVISGNQISVAATAATVAGIAQRSSASGNVITSNKILCESGVTCTGTGLYWDGAGSNGLVKDNVITGSFTNMTALPASSTNQRVVSDNLTVIAPAPTTLPVTDTFNRADSTTGLGTSDSGASWTSLAGVFGISTSKAYVASGSGQNFATIDVSASDVVLQCTVAGTSAADQGFALRMVNNSTGYFVQFNSSGAVQIYRATSGSFTQLGTVTTTVTTNDVMKVTGYGNLITVYKNGTQILQVTDSTYATATKHGLWGFGASQTAAVRSWKAFSITAATAA